VKPLRVSNNSGVNNHFLSKSVTFKYVTVNGKRTETENMGLQGPCRKHLLMLMIKTLYISISISNTSTDKKHTNYATRSNFFCV